MSYYTIEIAEPTRTKAKLKRYAARLETLWPTVWGEVIDEVALAEAEWFASEGQSGAAKWAALKPAYAAAKDRVYPGEPILVATGELRSSVTDPNRLVVEVADAGPEGTLVLGSDDPTAEYHQEGTENMPARKIFIPGARVWEIVRAAVQKNTSWEL
jgi:predicted RecB family endonuclease